MTRATEATPISQSTSTISAVPMTTFAIRPPLQQLDNPHVMSQRGNGRRTSARLAEKDNTPNGDDYTANLAKTNQVTIGAKQSKVISEKTGNKRKPGEFNLYRLQGACASPWSWQYQELNLRC